MQRVVTESIPTPDAKESCADINMSEDALKKIVNYVNTFNFYPTKIQKMLCCSSDHNWEIWRSRIGHPEANRGKSGGLRIIHFYNFREQKGYLAKIWPKGDTLGRKGEKDFEKYWKDLQKELTEIWGS